LRYREQGLQNKLYRSSQTDGDHKQSLTAVQLKTLLFTKI